jgi:hypothetical protein
VLAVERDDDASTQLAGPGDPSRQLRRKNRSKISRPESVLII